MPSVPEISVLTGPGFDALTSEQIYQLVALVDADLTPDEWEEWAAIVDHELAAAFAQTRPDPICPTCGQEVPS